MRSPVLFLIFNRPKYTEASFAAIRKARPPRLYVAADGPRMNNPDDARLCAQTRRILERVDWPCEVKTLFRKENWGGPRGIPQALDWFFKAEPEGIILEDDIVCHDDFFVFCDALLERYRDDSRVMHITGNNFQLGLKHGLASYFFSKIPHAWGWATWARAWSMYRPVISQAEVEEFITNFLLVVSSPQTLGYVPETMFRCVGNSVGHWDARWFYTIFAANGLAATPNVPLTRNIGYGELATHTRKKNILFSIPLRPLGSITHPSDVIWNSYGDEVDYRIAFSGAVDSSEGLVAELKRRIAHGDPEESVQELTKIVKKYHASLEK
jgi:hypothetical protein